MEIAYRVWITAPKSCWLGVNDYDNFDWNNRMRNVSSIHFPLDSLSGKDISCESICENDYYANGWLGANYENDKLVSRDYILMPFSGLNDKNGIKIYVGDILLCKLASEPEDKGFICVFENSAFRFKNVRYPNDEKYDIKIDEYNYISEQLEVIGSIYQNPELI